MFRTQDIFIILTSVTSLTSIKDVHSSVQRNWMPMSRSVCSRASESEKRWGEVQERRAGEIGLDSVSPRHAVSDTASKGGVVYAGLYIGFHMCLSSGKSQFSPAKAKANI